MARSGVHYAEKTTWIIATKDGTDPTALAITKVDNDTLQAVTKIVNLSYADPSTAFMTKLRHYLDNAMVTSNDTFITAHLPIKDPRRIRGAGMEGTNAYAWEVDIQGDFTPPQGTTIADDASAVVMGTDTGYITVIVLRSFWVKDTNLIHEIMRKYTISASGGVVSNTLIHNKTYEPAGIGAPIGYAYLSSISPLYYAYISSTYEFPGNLARRTYLRRGDTNAIIHEVEAGNPEYKTALSERNNFMYNCRQFISDDERSLIGGRFITMTLGMTSNNNGHKIFWESSSGGVRSTTIPTYGQFSNVTRPYIILGISPNDEIYMVWQDTSTSKEFIVKYNSAGDILWEVYEEDWQYPGWEYLIRRPVMAMRASSTGTSEDLLYFNTRMLFDALGRPVLMATQVIPYSTTQGRTPYSRVTLDPETGKPLRAPLLGTVPAISGKVGLAIADIMSYNSTTDMAQQIFLVANTQSTHPISTTASLGKFRKMVVGSKLLLYISVKDGATGKVIEYNNYQININVNGGYAWLSYDNEQKKHFIELQPGDSWEVKITSAKYQPAKKSGTFGSTSSSTDILVQPRNWARKSYEIYTPQDLFDMREDPLGLYTIMNDIDMTGFSWETPFQGSEEAFMGSLEGQGYKIKNWTHNEASGLSYTGLTGATQNAVFKNIVFENCHFTGESGHGLSIVTGFSLNVPLFDAEREDVPPDYEELIAQYHNITFKQCTLGNRYGHGGTGFLFGDFVWSRPAPDEPVLDNIIVDRCKINGADYGSSVYGGVWGQASISVIEYSGVIS